MEFILEDWHVGPIVSLQKPSAIDFQLLVTMPAIAIFASKGLEMRGSTAESQYFVISVRDEEDGVIVREILKHRGNPILLYLHSNPRYLHFLQTTFLEHAVGNDQPRIVQNINLLSCALTCSRYFDQMSPHRGCLQWGKILS